MTEIPRKVKTAIGFLAGEVTTYNLDFGVTYSWHDLGFEPYNFNMYGEPSSDEIISECWSTIISFINEKTGKQIQNCSELFLEVIMKVIGE